MIEQGKRIYDMFNPVAGNVYIKVPVNPSFKDEDNTHFDGIKAIKELTAMGIPVNTTLIFTPEQAFLAAKAGAKFVSPFAGRIDDDLRKRANLKFDKSAYYPACGMEVDNNTLDDNGIISGIELVRQCVQIIEEYTEKLMDNDWKVKLNVIKTIQKVLNQDYTKIRDLEPLLSMVIINLRDEDDDVARAAAELLKIHGTYFLTKEKIFYILLNLLYNEENRVKELIIWLFGEIGKEKSSEIENQYVVDGEDQY